MQYDPHLAEIHDMQAAANRAERDSDERHARKISELNLEINECCQSINRLGLENLSLQQDLCDAESQLLNCRELLQASEHDNSSDIDNHSWHTRRDEQVAQLNTNTEGK